jgi:hypothetical protein
MTRSYDIDIFIEEFGLSGYHCYCYEGEDCIWIQPCPTENEAITFGDDYVNGLYIDGFPGGVDG